MKIRTYTAPTLSEALDKIKQEFGEQAIILKIRFNNNSPQSDMTVKSVEITAATDIGLGPRPQGKRAVGGSSTARRRIEYDTPFSSEPVADTGAVKIPDAFSGKTGGDALSTTTVPLSITHSDSGALSGPQLDIARKLIGQNLPENLAFNIVRDLDSVPGFEQDTVGLWKAVTKRICDLLSPGLPIQLERSSPAVVLLAGPTGGGKTSAAARLAFYYSIEKNVPVTLVSADVFRADSSQQLKATAAVSGCHFVGISSPDEIGVVLDEYKSGLILIDTSGISNEKDISALLSLMSAANPHEVHLVVPADIHAHDIVKIIRNHPDLGVSRLLVTKLDQSRCRGGIIAAAVECGLKFSFQSASREIPGFFGLFEPESFVSTLMPVPAAARADATNAFEVVGW